MSKLLTIENQPLTNALKPGVLSLSIKEKAALYAAYMPYIKGGGLFIPTNKSYKLGDEVFMLLSLIEEPVKLKYPATIAAFTYCDGPYCILDFHRRDAPRRQSALVI